MIDETLEYYERLLSLQFMASNNLNHTVTKGTLREEYVKRLVKEVMPKNSPKEGIICGENEWQSGQGDFIKLKSDAFDYDKKFRVEECLIFMEIKSNATRGEFNKLNEEAKKLKKQNPHMKIGIFCYKTKAKKETVLKNFGYLYDEDLQAYQEYDPTQDQFEFIDFCFSLNIDEEDCFNPQAYFLNRDQTNALTLYRGANGISINNLLNILNYEGAR